MVAKGSPQGEGKEIFIESFYSISSTAAASKLISKLILGAGAPESSL
jgi:hypothetical protein